MFGAVWLYVLIAACVVASDAAAVKKKIKEESTAVTTEAVAKSLKATTPAPAILAIEIVDENEPEEGGKKNNSKRTIDGSLGYGFNQNYFGTTRNEVPKKFEFYPYSQHDIPPLPKTSHYNPFSHGPNHHGSHISSSINHGNTQFDIQKSVAYDLGTHTTRVKSPQVPSLKFQNNYFHSKPSSSSTTSFLPSKPSQHQSLNPGTTLYTLVDQGGHTGHLSSNFPPSTTLQGSGGVHKGAQHGGPQVPVIVLRVYPSQLQGSGALYPNIPQSSPYSNLNNINLQSLLSGYLNQHGYQVAPGGQSDYYSDYPEQTYMDYTQQYHQPEPQTPAHKYTSQGSTAPQVFPRAKQQPIAENYPDDAHTRVVFTHEPSSGYKSAAHDSARPVTLPSHQPPQYHRQNQGYQSQKSAYTHVGGIAGKGQHHSSQKVVTATPAEGPAYQYQYQTEAQGGGDTQYVYEDLSQDSGASFYTPNGVDYQQVYDNQPGVNSQTQYVEEEQSAPNQGYQSERIVHETNFPSSTPAPYNYHAHLGAQGIKQQRNKKRNTATASRTTKSRQAAKNSKTKAENDGQEDDNQS